MADGLVMYDVKTMVVLTEVVAGGYGVGGSAFWEQAALMTLGLRFEGSRAL